MTEVDLYGRFKKNLPICIHTTRFENSVSSGMPDVFVETKKGDFWIENKICGFNQKINIRQSQLFWMFDRACYYKHGHVYVLISENKKKPIYTYIDMMKVSKEIYKEIMFKKPTLNDFQKMLGDEHFYTGYTDIKDLRTHMLENFYSSQ